MRLHLYHFYILRTVAAGTSLSDKCAGEISLQKSYGLESRYVSHTHLATRVITSTDILLLPMNYFARLERL